jgi:uncharacterized repeat protein (TIGR04042 family)
MIGVEFDIFWPDGSVTMCFAPSPIVSAVLPPDRCYAIDELLTRSRAALGTASERSHPQRNTERERRRYSCGDSATCAGIRAGGARPRRGISRVSMTVGAVAPRVVVASN